MINERLLKYVENQLRLGVPSQEIFADLRHIGWSQQDTHEVLKMARTRLKSAYLRTDNISSRVQTQGWGIFKKAKVILSNPSGFFEEIEYESARIQALKYYLVISLIPLVISTIILILFTQLLPLLIVLSSTATPLGAVTNFILLYGLTAIIMFYLIGIFLTVAISAITHAVGRILGFTGSFSETYKALVYGLTPTLLLGIAPFLGIFSIFWSFYLQVKGLASLHRISLGRATAILILSALIALVCVWIAFNLILDSLLRLIRIPA